MRIKFQRDLDELKHQLLNMAGLAEEAIERVIAGYTTGEMSFCDRVLANEAEMNAQERKIDQMALNLLATEQPMAIDLRFIVSVIRINADLERVGDQAVNIAMRVKEMAHGEMTGLPVDLAGLGRLSSAMVRQALQSFVLGDVAMAYAVLALDDEVDAINRAAFAQLGERVRERPETTFAAFHALLITRNFERISDHATNIAEDVIFWVQGADVRHDPTRG